MSFELKIRNTVRPTSVIVDSSPTDNVSLANKSYVDSAISAAVAAKGITLTGDITGSGTSSISTTLAPSGTDIGVFNSSLVDAKGRITAAELMAVTGDINVSYTIDQNLSLFMDTSLATNGVVAGTYSKVTVDNTGRVTVGGQLSNTDIITALGYTPINKAGDTMTGNLSVTGNPTDPEHVVNKAYIDSKIWLAIAVGY